MNSFIKPLPPHAVGDDGAVTWRGEPLKFSHLQEIIYALRNAKQYDTAEAVEVARRRWGKCLLLIEAVLNRIPSEKTLTDAIPELPQRPLPPPKPLKPKFFRIPREHRTFDAKAYESAMAHWEAEVKDWEVIAALHDATLDENRLRVTNWTKFGGASGIEKIRLFRERFLDLHEKFLNRLERDPLGIGVLPFELLPPGLWNLPSLFAHLGTRRWRVEEIVPERLTHLFDLNPVRVYQGEIHRLYREYLLFLYGEKGPAVLETPFHGNATYVLESNWFTLCQLSKGELVNHPDATRVIHYDMPSWRREICRILEKPMPGHSNEY